MPTTDSPLRYPGGKTKIYNKVKRIIDDNMDRKNRIYVEPYAGGAGLALKLLYNSNVQKLILNDFDYHIFCFWKSCLKDVEALCNRIANCKITIDEWHIQKDIYENAHKHTLEQVGFATFYLNRCNVSGILKGGPIGGMGQKGKYKIDARFNKKDLISKIKRVSSYSDKIEFYNMDAIEFLDKIVSPMNCDNIFLNIDPPYVKKGPMLYKNSYTEVDHSMVAARVAKLGKRWIVTYDECELIKNLYGNFRMETMELNYSAGNAKSGQEYIVYSDLLKVEEENDWEIANS